MAFIPAGDRDVLRLAGELPERDDGPSLTLSTLHNAVRIVPEIVTAYDRAHAAKPVARRRGHNNE